MDTQIIWWTAIIGGSLDTIKQLIADGANPLQTLNGKTGSEAVLSFSRRLQRMSRTHLSPVQASVERLARYSEIISFLHEASERYLANITRRSFLRRWVRFHRREKMIRDCILCKKIFSACTQHCVELGPLEIMVAYLSSI